MSKSMDRVEGRVALVTGAASGIGFATARRLTELGAVVVGIDVNAEGLAAAAAELEADGSKLDTIVSDFGEVENAAEAVREGIRRQGRVDILVNAAGIYPVDDFSDADLSSFQRCLAINLVAPFLTVQEAGNAMVARGEGGKIVNLTSSTAFRARLAPPAYSAAKAGIVALTRSAAATYGPHNINVNAVAPGITDTPMMRAGLEKTDEEIQEMLTEGVVSNLMHRISQPEDVANVVAFLCTDASRQITGGVLHTSAGAVL